LPQPAPAARRSRTCALHSSCRNGEQDWGRSSAHPRGLPERVSTKRAGLTHRTTSAARGHRVPARRGGNRSSRSKEKNGRRESIHLIRRKAGAVRIGQKHPGSTPRTPLTESFLSMSNGTAEAIFPGRHICGIGNQAIGTWRARSAASPPLSFVEPHFGALENRGRIGLRTCLLGVAGETHVQIVRQFNGSSARGARSWSIWPVPGRPA